MHLRFVFVCTFFHCVTAYLHSASRGSRHVSNKLKVFSLRVPASYEAVESLLVDSLVTSLPKISSADNKKYFIEVRTPGLNDKIEQSAIVSKDLLYDLSKTMIRPLLQCYSSVKFMFPSSGDAAGFQAYCNRRQISIPSDVILTDIASDRTSPQDKCLLMIGARNNVGDPVIRTVQQITDSNPSVTCILLNCDLSDRVTTGMTSRTLRDTYRASFQPLFYFRNLVTILRPSQIPLERGALIYTPSEGWTVFAVDQSRIVGPGSLNRFMRTPAFYRTKGDPTSTDPPEFILAGSYSAMPKRDEIDETLTRAAGRLERVLERRRRARAFADGAEALQFLKSCVDAGFFDKQDDIEEALACLLRSPVRSQLSSVPQREPVSVLDSSQRMGVVSINLVEAPETSTVISSEGSDSEAFYKWDESTVNAILGGWTRAHCIGSTIMSEVLNLQRDGSGISVALEGSSPRRGQLMRDKDSDSTRMELSLDPQTFFGLFNLAEAQTEGIRVLYIDRQMLVLQETGSNTLSLWRRT